MASDLIPKPGAIPVAPKKAIEPEAVKSEEKKAPKKIAVVAIEPGWFDNSRKKAGDKFFIDNEKQFSSVWMEKIK